MEGWSGFISPPKCGVTVGCSPKGDSSLSTPMSLPGPWVGAGDDPCTWYPPSCALLRWGWFSVWLADLFGVPSSPTAALCWFCERNSKSPGAGAGATSGEEQEHSSPHPTCQGPAGAPDQCQMSVGHSSLFFFFFLITPSETIVR